MMFTIVILAFAIVAWFSVLIGMSLDTARQRHARSYIIGERRRREGRRLARVRERASITVVHL